MDMRIELSPDSKKFTRSIYTVLDWLGDVGGLFDALKALGSTFIFIHAYIRGREFEIYLLNRLYKMEKESSMVKDVAIKSDDHLTRIKSLAPFTLRNAYFHCLRSKKEKRTISKGINRALRELDVENFIRMQMQVKIALKTLFTKSDRILL